MAAMPPSAQLLRCDSRVADRPTTAPRRPGHSRSPKRPQMVSTRPPPGAVVRLPFTRRAPTTSTPTMVTAKGGRAQHYTPIRMAALPRSSWPPW